MWSKSKIYTLVEDEDVEEAEDIIKEEEKVQDILTGIDWGWHLYSPYDEFKRLGLADHPWRLCSMYSIKRNTNESSALEMDAYQVIMLS
jgi:hypothetical protein